jgi:hypothetical protein
VEIHFLVTAANEVFRIAVLPPHPTQDNLIRAAGIACKAFNRLTSDPEFSQLLRQMTLRREEWAFEFHQITSSIHHFRDFFLVRDLEMLGASGVDPMVLDAIKREGENLAAEIGSRDADHTSILQRVSVLRDDVCYMSSRFNAIEPAAVTRKRIQKIATGIAGTVVVVVNATPFALQYLSPAGTTVSNLLGSALLGAALAS